MTNLNRLLDEEFGLKHVEAFLPYVSICFDPLASGKTYYKINIINTTENLCKREQVFAGYIGGEEFNLSLDEIKECLILYFLCFNKMTKNKVKCRQRIRLTQVIAKEHIHTEEHELYTLLHKKPLLDLYEDFLLHQRNYE